MKEINKKQLLDNIGEILEQWIDDSIDNMQKLKNNSSIPSNFTEEYIRVLESAKNQIEDVQTKMSEFLDLSNNSSTQREGIIMSYVNAMTIKHNDEDVFLPCFSDRVIQEITRKTKEPLTPYRGIYISWKLGEIYHKWMEHSQNLEKIEKEIEVLLGYVKAQNDFTKKLKYTLYINKLGKDNTFDSHIKAVKESLEKVVFPRKFRWIHILPYPSVTSTHFYLSGIRYYLYPALYHSKDLANIENISNERFHVHSTDSGLFKPSKHYGAILKNINNPDEIEELLDVLPPGTLMLDLVKEENGQLTWNTNATKKDRENLIYFEIWSKKITEFAEEVLSETLNRIREDENEAKNYFERMVSKNPLRKFYFDTGIYQAITLSKEYSEIYPKVFYLTTQRSKVDKSIFKCGYKILEHFLDNGVEYHYLDRPGWTGEYEPLAYLTLFPTKELSKFTIYLSSERDKSTRKISHGHSYWALYAYSSKYKNALKLAERISQGIGIIAPNWETSIVVILILSGIGFVNKLIPVKLDQNTLNILKEVRTRTTPIKKNNAKNYLVAK